MAVTFLAFLTADSFWVFSNLAFCSRLFCSRIFAFSDIFLRVSSLIGFFTVGVFCICSSSTPCSSGGILSHPVSAHRVILNTLYCAMSRIMKKTAMEVMTSVEQNWLTNISTPRVSERYFPIPTDSMVVTTTMLNL